MGTTSSTAPLPSRYHYDINCIHSTAQRKGRVEYICRRSLDFIESSMISISNMSGDETLPDALSTEDASPSTSLQPLDAAQHPVGKRTKKGLRRLSSNSSIGKQRRRPSGFRRLSSTASTSTTAKRGRVVRVESDHAPHRLVNPLTEYPEGRVTGAGDFIPLLDLWYGLPDTYTIHYLSRLLGLVVPDAVDPQSDSIASNEMNDMAVRHVPRLGQWASMILGPNSRRDDEELLSRVDPTYTALLAPHTTQLRPLSSTHQQKIAAQVMDSIGHLQQLARTTGCYPEDCHTCRATGSSWTVTSYFSPGAVVADIAYRMGWWSPSGRQQQRPSLVLRLERLRDGGIEYLIPVAAAVKEEWSELPPLVHPVHDQTGSQPAEYTTTRMVKATIVSNRSEKPRVSQLGASDCVVAEKPTRAVDSTITRSPDQLLPSNKVSEGLFVYLVALALEHARACGVAYALVHVPDHMVGFFQTYFRMTLRKYDASNHNSGVRTLVCDLQKCSYRYAFLLFRERKGDVTIFSRCSLSIEGPKDDYSVPKKAIESSTDSRERWLVRLPSQQDVASALEASKVPTATMTAANQDRSKRAVPVRASVFFSGATGATRNVAIHFRAKLLSPGGHVECRYLSGTKEGPLIKTPEFETELPTLDVLKSFELPTEVSPVWQPQMQSEEGSEILLELVTKQKQLEALENGLLPGVKSLLAKVIQERAEYEGKEESEKREKERQILAENEKMLQRRKEQDLVFLKQMEQDMDAVCEICTDGEVTPDNQILFCEACNVAVHQVCYGIETVPEGDYYCLPCRRLGRNKTSGASKGDRLRLAGAPLPISCELCPLKQGAFVQTDVKPKEGDNNFFGKWIHVLCAKWQGLSFVNSRKTDLIEDVTELKVHFRQHKLACCLCRGERGAVNNCRIEGCDLWMHVTCARAVGTCEVIHGEDAKGGVGTNSWTLKCPEHSKIKPENVPKGSTSVEKLILFAKAFPPEPKPPPLEVTPMPFNTVGGEERDQLLQNEKYEQALLFELTTKKLFGFRCEVCDICEEDGRNLNRCSSCAAVTCVTCLFAVELENGNFKCASCRFVDQKKKAKEDFETPQCIVCKQKNGLLREGFANPVSRKSFWHHNQNHFQRSLFGKPIWVHTLCAL
jgi:hypothetical protein